MVVGTLIVARSRIYHRSYQSFKIPINDSAFFQSVAMPSTPPTPNSPWLIGYLHTLAIYSLPCTFAPCTHSKVVTLYQLQLNCVVKCSLSHTDTVCAHATGAEGSAGQAAQANSGGYNCTLEQLWLKLRQ